MQISNSILMKRASESLKGQWPIAIITFLIFGLLISAPQMSNDNSGFSMFSIITLFISGPLYLGAAFFSLAISRGKVAKIEQLFDGFHHFKVSFIAYLLVAIFTILWMLLLIIPGIIAAISYSMTFYIIADNKSIDAMEAIEKSKEMMYGHKWDYFFLCLRFFGLGLLCILTLGIGFLWLVPYVNVTTAKFYDTLLENETV